MAADQHLQLDRARSLSLPGVALLSHKLRFRRWRFRRRLIGGKAHIDMVVTLVTSVTPAKRAACSPCDDLHRWVTAAGRAGVDAETGGGDVEPGLPTLQLAADDPAVRRRLLAPDGDPRFQTTKPAAIAK